MIITKIIIAFEPRGEADIQAGLDNRQILMKDKEWTFPNPVFPRDLKFISGLQQLVEHYNR